MRTSVVVKLVVAFDDMVMQPCEAMLFFCKWPTTLFKLGQLLGLLLRKRSSVLAPRA